MHEMGTVMYVIRAVNEVCEQNKLSKVASVTLEIGEVSGIIPEYIQNFWHWAVTKEKCLRDAELIIEPIKSRYSLRQLRKKPTKQSNTPRSALTAAARNTWLETGNEYNIKEIAVFLEAN